MNQRKRRSRDQWRAHLAELQASGLTHKQFAQRIGVHPSIFGWWRKRLKESEDKGSQRAANRFVELVAAKAAPPKRAPTLRSEGTRLEGPSGIVVIFDSRPPADYLAAVLRGG